MHDNNKENKVLIKIIDAPFFRYREHPCAGHPFPSRQTIRAGVILGTISSYGLACLSSSDMLEPAVRGGRGEYWGVWYCSQTSSPIRPDPGSGSEILRVLRPVGWPRFLLRMSTKATMATAPAADPMTMPTLAPAVRPGAAAAVLLEVEEALLAVADDEVDEPPLVAVDAEDAPEEVSEAADASLVAVAVVEAW